MQKDDNGDKDYRVTVIFPDKEDYEAYMMLCEAENRTKSNMGYYILKRHLDEWRKKND